MFFGSIHLILISGPPRTGKNRAGLLLATELGGDHFALSDYLKIETHKHYELDNAADVFYFEQTKDEKSSYFKGKTPREAYIDFSENILKPRYGLGYLGEIARSRVLDNINKKVISIVSGVGFYEEVYPLIVSANPQNTVHIRIINSNGQSGCFTDSRKHLDFSHLGVSEVELHHNDEDRFLNQVLKHLDEAFFLTDKPIN